MGFALLAFACGSADDNDPEDKQCSFPEGERGTPECQRWHAAICAWASECGTMTHCECVDQASAISCASEAEATRCAEGLESLACSSPPSGCDLTDIADRAPARAACERYIATVCARQDCTGVDPATCAADGALELDCSTAVGVTPSFEQCITELETLACTADPSSCDGVLLFDF